MLPIPVSPVNGVEDVHLLTSIVREDFADTDPLAISKVDFSMIGGHEDRMSDCLTS